MLIPYQELSQEALHNLIEAFLVMQIEDGNLESRTTQYIQSAHAEVLQRIKRGHLIIEYAEEHNSVMIRPIQDVV
tara:strand:+ start:1495 stop:1719 length:225 start_codon:yes stop_codon:yes gene_type:complete